PQSMSRKHSRISIPSKASDKGLNIQQPISRKFAPLQTQFRPRQLQKNRNGWTLHGRWRGKRKRAPNAEKRSGKYWTPRHAARLTTTKTTTDFGSIDTSTRRASTKNRLQSQPYSTWRGSPGSRVAA